MVTTNQAAAISHPTVDTVQIHHLSGSLGLHEENLTQVSELILPFLTKS